MASGSASSPRPAPDENEFPFGCPPVACQEPAEPRALRCAACLPENVRSGEDRICPKCQGDDPQSGSPGSPLSQEKEQEPPCGVSPPGGARSGSLSPDGACGPGPAAREAPTCQPGPGRSRQPVTK